MCGSFEPQAPRDNPSRLRTSSSRNTAPAAAASHDDKLSELAHAPVAAPKPGH